MFHFKALPVLVLVSLISTGCTTLKNISAIKVDNELRRVIVKMQKIQNVSFCQYKHMYNQGANYEFKDTTFIFNTFDTENKILPKFQMRSSPSKTTSIFNGTEFFLLQDTKRTYSLISDSTKITDKTATLFRQSWANILAILPTVIHDKAVIKSGKDTLINAHKFYVANFYYPGKKFNPLSGLSELGTDTIRWKYELIIDKQNSLPNQFNMYIQTKHIKTPNFIKVMFVDINQIPTYPTERSWFFSTYAKEYPNYLGNEKRAALITSGKSFPEWKLSSFTPQGPDTLLSNADFKGDVILYAFWIKNCGYSQDALPEFNKIQRNFTEQKFQLVAINCEDTKKDIEFFYKKMSPNYSMLYNGSSFSRNLGIYSHPIFVLVDKNNVIVKVFNGFDYTQIITSIQEVLR